jgi:hypothetical protein
MKTRRFNDIANFSNPIQLWNKTLPSSLPGWYWQARREEVAGIDCLTLLLMSDDPNERSAEFQTGLVVWREAVPADSRGVPSLEQADLMASAKIAALEFILRNGVFQAEMEARREEWRKKDQETHQLKQVHQEEVQKLRAQFKAQEEEGLSVLAEHKQLKQKCEALQSGVNAAKEVVAAAAVKGKGAAAQRQTALSHLKAVLSDLDSQNPQGKPCKYQVTFGRLPGEVFQDRVKAIKAIREATGMDLLEAKKTGENGTVFEVPYEKLMGFCLGMETLPSVQWRAVKQ